jgi:hypothetical protein
MIGRGNRRSPVFWWRRLHVGPISRPVRPQQLTATCPRDRGPHHGELLSATPGKVYQPKLRLTVRGSVDVPRQLSGELLTKFKPQTKLQFSSHLDPISELAIAMQQWSIHVPDYTHGSKLRLERCDREAVEAAFTPPFDPF